jgi:hypothetical protein
MCARRFLAVIFVLTLLVVAGAFAIFQWGNEILIRQSVPSGKFEAPAEAGPDYAAIGQWIARPDMVIRSNPAAWRPDDFPPRTLDAKRLAVFYVHPTTYLERDRWNAPLNAGGESDRRAELFVQSQASAFGNSAAVWAPHYRQAAYGAFLLNSADAHQALDLAYSDVAAAFGEFLRRVPGDQGVVLAGHSQGALHVSRLLGEQREVLRDRLVAAYVVGWPLGVRADLAAMQLPPCTRPEQAGCVLSWQSFAEPANPGLVLSAWEGTTGPTGVRRQRRDMLCVNPLTGTRDGVAPPQANPGTLVPTADMAQASIISGRVGARCENGFLLIDGDIPNLGPFVLPGNNYHVYDFALFWAAIARDAERRGRTWIERWSRRT